MNQIVTGTLLPVGKTIEHDGRFLHIEKRISAGLTGEVYAAILRGEGGDQIPVAVKVMKTLEFAVAREMFMKESETLAFLMHIEKNMMEKERSIFELYKTEPPKVAPVYYGRGEYENIPYFIMEFINGETLPTLLERKSKLPELQSLILAWHLFRTFDILHKELKKTYIDLKFENLWWVGDDEGVHGQLKLTDFGTLEEANERGIRRDLLLGSVYLLKFLTGYTLKYSLGELRELANPVLMENKDKLSWGVYHLLQQLLHRNPENRPGDAGAVSEELRSMVMMWWSQPEEQIKLVEARLDRAESNPECAFEQAVKARTSLDIIQRHLPDYENDRINLNITRADDILKSNDFLVRGKALLLGRSYDLARKAFETGKEWSDNPAEMRRWAYLAMCGETISSQTFGKYIEEAMKAVDLLNHERWKAGNEILAKLTTLKSPGYQALKNDGSLFAALDEAENARAKNDFQKAEEKYRDAWTFLTKLPDHNFIIKNEVSDLRLLADEMARSMENRGVADQMLEVAKTTFESGKQEAALKLAMEAIYKDRFNGDRLKNLQDLIEMALLTFAYNKALQFSELGLLIPAKSDEFNFWRSEAIALESARVALEKSDYVDFGVELRKALLDSSNNSFIDKAVRHLLEFAEKQAEITENECLYNTIAEFYSELYANNEKADELKRIGSEKASRHNQKLSAMADRLMAKAQYYIHLEDPQMLITSKVELSIWDHINFLKNRTRAFSDADKILASAARITRTFEYHHQDELNEIIKYVKEQLDSLNLNVGKSKQELENYKAKELGRLRQNWIWITTLDPADKLKWQKDFIGMCDVYIKQFKDDTEIRALRDLAINGIDSHGFKGWKEIRETAEEHLSVIENKFTTARKTFEDGDYEDTCVQIEQLRIPYGSSDEWQHLKNALTQTASWLAWMDKNKNDIDNGRANPELLGSLRRFINLDIPRIYFQQEGMQLFFQKAYKISSLKVRNLLTSDSTDAFVHALRSMLEIQLTWRAFHEREINQAPNRD